MKKVLCLVLCVFLALSFTACGKNSNKGNQHSVDIEYFAKLGQISDVEYKLGDNIDETKSLLAETPDDHGASNYFDYESGDYTIMTDGTVSCCYKTDDKDAGITHIVKHGEAYGFEVGAVSTQVRDTMSNMGFDAVEREAKNGEIFFLPSGADMSVLEYKIKDCTVLFVFSEHAFSAAVISK